MGTPRSTKGSLAMRLTISVTVAPSFEDTELIPNMVNLRSLEISYAAVSREGTNVLSRMPNLTNAVVRISKSSL